MVITRRNALKLAAGAAAGLGSPLAGFAQDAEIHGLSTFGDLALPPDFKHFPYVNPKAPKGGALKVQIKNTSGNQNFETFDTLHIYSFRGDGAAGMDATFDSLMAGTLNEPNSMYGLVARSVRISPDKLAYRFMLRPEARFHDGSPLRARDCAFSLNILKEKGHPIYRSLLRDFAGAEAESEDVLLVRFSPTRGRDTHLLVAGLPIFSEAWWKGRDFEATMLEAPLGSGPYKVARFEQGRYVEFERVADYWAANLPVSIGQNNFDRIRYDYFRERQIAFEAFKSGQMNFQEEFTARFWATGYDFPAVREGRVQRVELPSGGAVGTQGWIYNTRRAKFADSRIREALNNAFDFEWTNRNIMYSAYSRLTSYFENSEMKATGKPGPEELALLEPFRAQVPPEVFGEPWVPPVSDGSGSDRALLRRANDLLTAAGCKRDGSRLRLPDGSLFEIEFLDSQGALKPHTEPFQANLRRLGIESQFRQVDAAQYKRRVDNFDFDIITMALGGSLTPGEGLRNIYSSQAAKTPGSRNLGGISSPAIDAIVEKMARAQTREELTIAARVLDRLLRAGRYWIPMWYKDRALIAHWDVFGRPETQPKYGNGAPGLWWWDADKARKIGYS
ncbi:MAG: extracellular solute-binding protein [Beijerinckiaceae bacterium]|nr:extracellular solute-binding protein [Beijerinckiaceae bacterium]